MRSGLLVCHLILSIKPAVRPRGRSLRVSTRSRLAFGIGDFAFNIVWQGTSLFLLYFYTDVLGLDPVIAGIIYLAAMVWDAVTDPFVATLIDRVRSRWGRYRPFLLFGAVPFGLSYGLAFSPPLLEGVSLTIWALLTHLLLRASYTLVGVPFSALQARLTEDSGERSVLAAFRMIGAALGGLSVVVFTPTIVTRLSQGSELMGYMSAAFLGGAIAAMALLYAFFAMREPDCSHQKQRSYMEDIRGIGPMLVKNKPLQIVFAIITVGSMTLSMFGKNILYYFKYAVERPELAMIALIMPAIGLLVLAPIWVLVANRTSKPRALIYGACLASVGYLAFLAAPADLPVLIFGSIALISIGTSVLPVMFWAMLPDTVEHGELVTGHRDEAKIFGFATFAQKVAVGLNALFLGACLSWIGFEPNATQTPETVLGLKLLMGGVPFIGACVLIILARAYPIDAEEHRRTLDSLQRLRPNVDNFEV